MTLVFPVANGVLPRPGGGRITGVFLFDQGGELLSRAGVGRDVLVCPWLADRGELYPVGVAARVLNAWTQSATDASGREVSLVMAVLEGRGHARWHSLRTVGGFVASPDIEAMNLKVMRKDYPAVSGAGWLPAGGFTEFRDPTDIPVTIYGPDLETGREVRVRANLGGLVSLEQAHTIEHGIIRALTTCGLCTPRTLLDAIEQETDELKQSVEFGMRFALPEVLGRTASGSCGNPMSSLAQFYLAKEFIDNVSEGKSFHQSLQEARRSAMSQLTGELGLTTERGLRVLQGLKKGMSHDDSRLRAEVAKKVIIRFPLDPWG